MHETDHLKERVILASVATDGDVQTSDESCLDELAELVNTADGEVVGRIIQKRENMHPGHYLGKGKLLELQDLISLTHATGIVCDDELSSTQQRKLVDALHTKVMDRSMVILDIFAKRANTAEGKVQVEMAQLKYQLAHLTGLGKQLSRLGGGIGTRGPGEKKLETDRRHIKNRIAELNKALKEIQIHREVLRGKRRKSHIPVVSFVGYTNAGKSTLMNVLSNADVLAENKLFATLDTTTRKVTMPGGSDVLFTDTVGFIQKLPHHLIQAFRATLEELKYADILIHVIDAGNPARDMQMDVVYETLKALSCFDKPVITVFNKMDLAVEKPLPHDKHAKQAVNVSAIERTGIESLLRAVEDELKEMRQKVHVLIPYADGKLMNVVHGSCEIISEAHQQDGTSLELYADTETVNRLAKYIVR